jgi:Fe-S-cluster-containing dehydrogenase component
MRRWNMIIDVARCEDCNNCFLACKDEHVGNDWSGIALAQPLHGHRWMNIMRRERGSAPMIDVAYRPTPCMHCDNAPCIEKALDRAIYKRADGIVIIDPEKAAGQRELVEACPYGAIFWNEERNVPQKCTFCAHLIDNKWEKPRCAQSCPAGALTAVCVEDDEMAARAEAEGLQTLLPEKAMRPRVYYKNLYLHSQCFIGGSVSYRKDGKDECAADAMVTLSRDAGEIAIAVADCYGDFKLDRLEDKSGAYKILISFLGHEKALDVELNSGSVYLGDVTLP